MKKNFSGFTLVEIVIALVILTVGALGITQFLISLQYTAEDNLYESTALNIALSTLEQMKSTPIPVLDATPQNGVFELTTDANTTIQLNLGQANIDIPVPTITNNGNPQNILITLTPSITDLTGEIGFLLRVEYAYEHPRSGRIRTKVLSAIRSRVPSF